MLYDTSSLMKCISIHALLAESDYFSGVMRQNPGISIHALLAESDLEQSASYNAYLEISIHALLAESDIHGVDFRNVFMHFYPRSPCGERPSL